MEDDHRPQRDSEFVMMDSEKQAAQEQFKILLQRWETDVTRLDGRSWEAQRLASEFGKVAVQGAFVLNGGAIVVVPPLMQWLSDAGRAAVPSYTWYFLLGILLAAACCLLPYVNFMAVSSALRHWATARGMELNAQHSMRPPPTDADPNYRRETRGRRFKDGIVTATQVAAVISCIGSYVCLSCGAYQFIELAQRYGPTMQTIAPLDP